MKRTLLTLISIFCIALSVNAQTVWAAKSTINASTGDAPYTIASGIIDGDALSDVVIGTYFGNTIEWYKNNGDGTFTFQTLITNTLNGIGALKLVDLNGDTFLDILATGYNNDSVVWFSNDGSGNFGMETIISSTVSGASGVSLGDINGDTFVDLAITAYDGNEVVWFSNDGTGSFTLESAKIDDTLSSPGVVNLSDIDGDGDLDALVATAAYAADVIEIFRNDLVPGGTVAFSKDATSVATGKVGIFNASFEDLDGDSNLDILATEVSFGGGPTGNLYWYEDNGAGYTETVFTTTIVNPSVAQFKDVDADGVEDIVLSSGSSGSGNDLVWFKNNGSGSFGSETVIDNTQSQTFVYAVNDFDEDGDMDIVSCAYNEDDLNYFENLFETLNVAEFDLRRVSIFPNPTKDVLNFEGFNDSVIDITITDILGKNIMTKAHNSNESLDVSELAVGLYNISINGKFASKFIKE
ncbi:MULTISPECIES: FG-GAP-like repeat-containing protein [Winogradskyella]|uniref:T9SS type A sorting domain-containing protein n=1 Tax=Winogradskyella ouciana TaxID=2608631 RepID=A0A7K1G937_9FLAO|nr:MULTISPECIES: FG-GAP-like repeat-containing protein [Winogradskyella]MBO6880541.1 T9SS type A sorting domain-containing protein [Winogradskyella sp.]MTE25545.1 T9SS type A sorting domain-containing protein [Winogradskyella ouciana]